MISNKELNIRAILERKRFTLKPECQFQTVVSDVSSAILQGQQKLKQCLDKSFVSSISCEILIEIQKEKKKIISSVQKESKQSENSSIDLSSSSSDQSQQKDDTWAKAKQQQTVKVSGLHQINQISYESLKNKDIDSLSIDEMRRILKQYKQLNMIPIGNIPLPPPGPPPSSKIKPVKIYPHPNQKRQKQKPQAVVSSKSPIKTILYIKNLPNHYNTKQALFSYFKKYGIIKQIIVNPNKLTAQIIFAKQQSAIKAEKHTQNVFSKSFIFKTLDINKQPIEKMPQEVEMKTFQVKFNDIQRARKYKQQLSKKLSSRINTLLSLSIKYKGDKNEINQSMQKAQKDEKLLESMDTLTLLKYYQMQSTNNDYSLVFSISNFELSNLEIQQIVRVKRIQYRNTLNKANQQKN